MTPLRVHCFLSTVRVANLPRQVYLVGFSSWQDAAPNGSDRLPRRLARLCSALLALRHQLPIAGSLHVALHGLLRLLDCGGRRLCAVIADRHPLPDVVVVALLPFRVWSPGSHPLDDRMAHGEGEGAETGGGSRTVARRRQRTCKQDRIL